VGNSQVLLPISLPHYCPEVTTIHNHPPISDYAYGWLIPTYSAQTLDSVSCTQCGPQRTFTNATDSADTFICLYKTVRALVYADDEIWGFSFHGVRQGFGKAKEKEKGASKLEMEILRDVGEGKERVAMRCRGAVR
jgi:hypothetical protein